MGLLHDSELKRKDFSHYYLFLLDIVYITYIEFQKFPSPKDQKSHLSRVLIFLSDNKKCLDISFEKR